MVRTKPKPPSVSADDARLDVLQAQLEDNGHVCGNCRNQWFKTGREDCPNNRKERR